jgi:hypothetical protein
LKWGFKLRPSDTSGHLECLRGPLCLWSLLQWAGPAECFLHAASSGGTFFLASYSDFLTPLLPSSWGAGLQDMAWAPLGSLSRLLPGPLSRLVAELIPGTSRQGFSVPDDHGTSSHPRLGTPGDLQGVGGPAGEYLLSHGEMDAGLYLGTRVIVLGSVVLASQKESGRTGRVGAFQSLEPFAWFCLRTFSHAAPIFQNTLLLSPHPMQTSARW